METIAQYVSDAVDSEHISVDAGSFQNLLVHIVIALIRISHDCYMPIEDTDIKGIAETREYRAAEIIADHITDLTSISLPREEIAYIAIHLAGKQTIYTSPGDAGVVISDEVWRIVSEILDRIWSVFRVDFRDDLELRMNLARHIQPLSVRLRYNMKLRNPMLDEIKARYPLSFSISMDAAAVIADAYGSALSHDEIGYLALAFELALERSKAEPVKKNILVICASGAGSARLLEYQCRREFEDYIDQVQICDVMSLDKIDFSTIDYAFTTVPLNRELPVPVREVSCFLDSSEAEDARAILRGETRRGHLPAGTFVGRDLFIPHLSCGSKEEVLDVLIGQVEKARNVFEGFRELVLEREKCMPTAFGNGIALPHPLEAASDDTFVCVGLLEEPVAWGVEGEKVQAVFLSAFSGKGDGIDRTFFDALAGVLVDVEAIGRIVSDQTWETFAAVLGEAGIQISDTPSMGGSDRAT